jgi:hypothetical protein
MAAEGSSWVVIGVLVSKQIGTTAKGAPYSRCGGGGILYQQPYGCQPRRCSVQLRQYRVTEHAVLLCIAPICAAAANTLLRCAMLCCFTLCHAASHCLNASCRAVPCCVLVQVACVRPGW